MGDWKIPLFKVMFSDESLVTDRLRTAMGSGTVSEGVEVAELEDRFREYTGNNNVFATNSCSNGLFLSLRLLGAGPGKTVVTTPMTCVATACPVAWTGADIIWADIDPSTGLMNIDSARERIQDDTCAVMPMYWGGDVPSMEQFCELAVEAGIGVVEDAAQGFGARYASGGVIGSSTVDFTCISFQAIKHMTTGDGGVVICRDLEMSEKGKILSWFGIDRKNFRLPTGEINWDLDIPQVGYKMHMNNLTAALGNAQFPFVVNELLPLYQSNGARYQELFQGLDGVQIIPRIGQSAYWVYTLRCERRDSLMNYLIDRGIQASRMHTRIDIYSGLPVSKKWGLPGVDDFSKHNLCLPCGPWVSQDDQDTIVQLIRRFYRG
jgi:perosamine synthetase